MWNELKNSVSAIIKTNGNNEITGQLLQDVLKNIISNLGSNANFAGVATPDTTPGVPDGNVFYIASQPGTYSNFGKSVNSNEIATFVWNGTSWNKKALPIVIGDGTITSNMIASRAITSTKIEDEAIYPQHIVDEAITEAKLAEDAVGTYKVQNGAITVEKLSRDVLELIAESGGGGSGEGGGGTLGPLSVTTDKIAYGAVTNDRLDANSVSSDKIQDGAITGEKIAKNAVQTRHISEKSITKDLIAENAITTSRIKDKEVTFDKLSGTIQLQWEWMLEDIENLKNTSVTSQNVTSFVVLTQAEYDAKVTAEEINETTVYLITD